jgi:isopenicillin-N epimerase
MEAALTNKTRLLFFSHILSPTGLVLPARELCSAARRRGVVTVVDGAHAPAMIPLDIDGIGADFYGANCHKWLLAPIGSGFLHLGPGSEDRLQPLQVSWGWYANRARVDETDEFGTTPRLRYLEFEGTRDWCSWLTVPTAIDFQAGLGWDAIRIRIEELVRHVCARLEKIPGFTRATPAEPALHGAMTAFRMPADTPIAALRKSLWDDHRIEVPIIDRPEGPLIRVSTHFYNTAQEVDRLADVLEGLMRHGLA